MNALTTGRLLLTSLALTALASAEEATLSLRTLALDKLELPEWHIQVGENHFQKLDWPESQPSPAFAAMAAKELQLFKKVSKEGEEEKFKEAAKVTFPKGAKEILLLASADGEDGEIEVVAIADKLQKAKFNDWLVINRCERAVSLRFGKDKDPISLEAKEAGFYQVEAKPNQGGEVVANAMIRDEMRKVYSTFWSASAKQRSLVLVYEKDKRIKIRRIIDFLPAQK